MKKDDTYYNKDMENRKKIGLGLIAGLTSLSVLIGSVFDSSKDLLDDVQINPESVTETLTDLSENTAFAKSMSFTTAII